VHILWVYAGGVGGVGVAVGITVFAVEEINEVVAGGDGLGHGMKGVESLRMKVEREES
jgi:hypothetical protein